MKGICHYFFLNFFSSSPVTDIVRSQVKPLPPGAHRLAASLRRTGKLAARSCRRRAGKASAQAAGRAPLSATGKEGEPQEGGFEYRVSGAGVRMLHPAPTRPIAIPWSPVTPPAFSSPVHHPSCALTLTLTLSFSLVETTGRPPAPTVPRPSSGPSPAKSTYQVCALLVFPSRCAKPSTQTLT